MSEDSLDFTEQSDIDLPQLPAHKKAWSQKNLLASILSRYFNLKGELGGTRWPVWKADVKENDDVNEQIESANRYLSNLGWMVKLEVGEPWLLQIIPLPERQFPATKTLMSFWFLSMLTGTLAGMYWMDGARPEGGWFSNSAFVDALVGYTLPIFGVILVASLAQRYYAAKNDIRLGHLSPIPEPSVALFSIGILPKSMLIWPFGVLLIPSLPRMDARPWNDRSTLGWNALIVPSVMIVSGVILWVIGIILTPNLINITSIQYVPDVPLILSLIAPFVQDDFAVRLVWSHPFAKAGSMLCLFGWVSLLPIPTFPGGRLLIARTGMREARNSTNQFFLFAIILAFAWMFDAFGSFNIWLPILGVIFPLLLFLGAERRLPVIINEPKGIAEEDVRRMGIILFVIFLLALPAQTPFALDEDWDSDIIYGFDEIALVEYDFDNWSAEYEITITNPSSIKQNWQIDLANKNTLISEKWDFVWNCSDDQKQSIIDDGCGDEINPGYETKVVLTINWKNQQHSPIPEDFYLLLYKDDIPSIETVSIIPDLEFYPDSNWQLVTNESQIRRCIGINYSGESENYNITFPLSDNDLTFSSRMYWVDGFSGLNATFDAEDKQLCLRGQDQVVLVRSAVLNELKFGNHTFSPYPPSIQQKMFVPEEGINILSQSPMGWSTNFNSGEILSIKHNVCDVNPMVSTPARPQNDSQPWIWDTQYRDTAQIPEIHNNDSINIKFAEGDIISLCDQAAYPIPRTTITIENGPELILVRSSIEYRVFNDIWASAVNGELLYPEMANFSIYNPENTSIPVNIVQTTSGENISEWEILQTSNTLEYGFNQFDFAPPSSKVSTMWIDFDDGELYIFLGSYS